MKSWHPNLSHRGIGFHYSPPLNVARRVWFLNQVALFIRFPRLFIRFASARSKGIGSARFLQRSRGPVIEWSGNPIFILHLLRRLHHCSAPRRRQSSIAKTLHPWHGTKWESSASLVREKTSLKRSGRPPSVWGRLSLYRKRILATLSCPLGCFESSTGHYLGPFERSSTKGKHIHRAYIVRWWAMVVVDFHIGNRQNTEDLLISQSASE